MISRKVVALATAAFTLAGLTAGAALVNPASAVVGSQVVPLPTGAPPSTTSAGAAAGPPPVAAPAAPVEQTTCPDPGVFVGSHPTEEGALQVAIAKALPCAFSSTAWEPAGSKNYVVYLAPLNAHTRSVAQAIIDKMPVPKGVTVSLKEGAQSYSRARTQSVAVAKKFAGKVVSQVARDGSVTLVADPSLSDASLIAASHVDGYQAEPKIIHQKVTLTSTDTNAAFYQGTGGVSTDWSPGSAYTGSGLDLVGAYDVGSCAWKIGTTTYGGTVGDYRAADCSHIPYSYDYLEPSAGSGPDIVNYQNYGAGDALNTGSQGIDPYHQGYSMWGRGTSSTSQTGAYIENALDLSSAWTVSGWFELPGSPYNATATDGTVASCNAVGWQQICTLFSAAPYDDFNNYIDVGVLNAGSGNDYGVYLFGENGGVHAHYYAPGSGQMNITPGRPFFLTVTYDGNGSSNRNVDIYVNGLHVHPTGGDTPNADDSTHTEHLLTDLPAFGGSGSSYPYVFFNSSSDTGLVGEGSAVMDHLALFSTNLSSGQAQALYETEASGGVSCASGWNEDPSSLISGSFEPHCQSLDMAGTEHSFYDTRGYGVGGIEACTEGWALQHDGNIYREAAGHCAGDPGNATYDAGTNSVTTDALNAETDSSITCYFCSRQTLPAFGDSSPSVWPADLLLMDDSSGWDSTSNAGAGHFYDGHAEQGVSYDDTSYPAYATLVYKYGVTSGTSFAAVAGVDTSCDPNISGTPCFDAFYTDDMVPVDEAPGDSGGPVWSIDGDGKYVAEGTNEAVYTGSEPHLNQFNIQAYIEAWTGYSLKTCGC